MKVYIDPEEVFPVYTFTPFVGNESLYPTIEVTEEQVARWNRIWEEYDTMQDELSDLRDKSRKDII